ncbi:hypothetical protein HPB47_001510 [Ixodes persulcatus]|uniref:Uncharacterized protein n=1 Tax=Ixodes persulcatus TaxID=34615 RepID=A0AC60PNX5_IXOPE|nr:hypothetical protein HPB47_001510 [Ixodes persulcatus]
MLRLVQAFGISQLVFSTPYLPLRRGELDNVNALIRKIYKAALSLSPSTSTDRLFKLEVYNTAEELGEAHLTRLGGREDLAYVDAAEYTRREALLTIPSNSSGPLRTPPFLATRPPTLPSEDSPNGLGTPHLLGWSFALPENRLASSHPLVRYGMGGQTYSISFETAQRTLGPTGLTSLPWGNGRPGCTARTRSFRTGSPNGLSGSPGSMNS